MMMIMVTAPFTLVIHKRMSDDVMDGEIDEIEDEEEQPGTSREGLPSPHISIIDSKRQLGNDTKATLPLVTSGSRTSLAAESKQQSDASINNNSSNGESKRTSRSLSMVNLGLEEESPFDPLVRAHVRRTLQMFHDYYAGMVNEHRTEQGRMKAVLAAKMQQNESKGMEGELNVVENHMIAMKELNDRFQDSVTVLLDRYERHMSSLPACPFLLPIVVTLYVCPPAPSSPEVIRISFIIHCI
jgi:hypothetical protein